MGNPVLVEVFRGALTESRHRGAVAVIDAGGATVLALGNVAAPVYPRSACAAQPYYVAGTGRFCSEIMKRFGTRVLVKTGAEGVFCGALPEQGFGVALKCDDGATRAAEVAMAAIIARFLPMSDGERRALERFVRPTLRNWNGIEVGGLRPSDTLSVTPGDRRETRDP